MYGVSAASSPSAVKPPISSVACWKPARVRFGQVGGRYPHQRAGHDRAGERHADRVPELARRLHHPRREPALATVRVAP